MSFAGQDYIETAAKLTGFIAAWEALTMLYVRQFARSRARNEAMSSAVLSAGVWSMVVAHKQHPGPQTLALLPYLLPGCPFVIYCPYQEVCLAIFPYSAITRVCVTVHLSYL